jgi:hypothetical protein
MARPSDYTPEVADGICEQIALGKSLRAICRGDDMPDASTVYRWLSWNEAFREQYARAREDQADSHADEIIDIADNEMEDPNSRRVRIDARKWVAAKLKPKKYGERIDHNLQVNPISVNISLDHD